MEKDVEPQRVRALNTGLLGAVRSGATAGARAKAKGGAGGSSGAGLAESKRAERYGFDATGGSGSGGGAGARQRDLESLDRDELLAEASQMRRENEALKKELASFDLQFFEDLEDLKFKFVLVHAWRRLHPVVAPLRASRAALSPHPLTPAFPPFLPSVLRSLRRYAQLLTRNSLLERKHAQSLGLPVKPLQRDASSGGFATATIGRGRSGARASRGPVVPMMPGAFGAPPLPASREYITASLQVARVPIHSRVGSFS